MDEANRVKCLAAISNGGRITPTHFFNAAPGALGDLYFGRCLLSPPITIAFCKGTYWQASVVEEMSPLGTDSVSLRVFGCLAIVLAIQEGGNAVWSDRFYLYHISVINSICLYDKAHDKNVTIDQMEALVSAYGDVKRRFNINAETGQFVTFEHTEGNAAAMVSLTDKGQLYTFPFEVEATHWEPNAVYVYLKQVELSRPLISFSFDETVSSVNLDTAWLVNPQQQIAQFLIPAALPEVALLQPKLYGILFEGISDGSEGNYNFIISRDDVISFVHRSSTGRCLKIDALQDCVVTRVHFGDILGIKLNTTEDPSNALLTVVFYTGDEDLRSEHMSYDNNKAVECGGGDILGLDRLFYH
eukprot:GHVS01101551.1.p1 GENE.GHVS01101551.1~~GHVS01101551.1.p1  ORF type:complete len:358 (-),score=12.49 GHVS01101551.1:232-1305(-)